MSNAALRCNELQSSGSLRIPFPLALIVLAWLGLVLYLGANEVFVTEPVRPPLALLFAVATPVGVFLGAYWLFDSVREFTHAANLSVITAVQAWRVGGYSFLVMYSYGLLPGFFAWPAGLGDMAIGSTAPLLVAMLRKPKFVGSKSFVTWNVLGILDLVAAVTLGAIASRLIENAGGVVPTTAMAYLPLVLIPTFFVPVFVILHLAALLKSHTTL